MKNMVVILALSAAIIVVAGEARAGGVRLKDLPKAVQETVDRETQGAILLNLSTEKIEGQTVYELETKRGSYNRDLLIDSRGQVLEVEEELAVSSLPDAVRRVLETRGRIIKVEALIRKGITSYEATLEVGDKRSEVTIGADGTVLKK
jgi:uncharacterized membrane protein YkoI